VSRQQVDTTSCRAHRLEPYGPDGQAAAAAADNEYKMRGLGNRALLLATITAVRARPGRLSALSIF
jgi:hypothetical protein